MAQSGSLSPADAKGVWRPEKVHVRISVAERESRQNAQSAVPLLGRKAAKRIFSDIQGSHNIHIYIYSTQFLLNSISLLSLTPSCFLASYQWTSPPPTQPPCQLADDSAILSPCQGRENGGLCSLKVDIFVWTFPLAPRFGSKPLLVQRSSQGNMFRD